MEILEMIESIIARHKIIDLAQEYFEKLQEGILEEEIYNEYKANISSDYESEIWEIVDSEDNEDDYEFSDIVYEIMLEIESLADYILENVQNG